MAVYIPLDPIPKFLGVPGKPPIPWEEWVGLFDNFLEASPDIDEVPMKRKVCILLHYLGTEGQRRYAKLQELTNYPAAATDLDKAKLKLEKEFKTSKHKRSERAIFRDRRQLPGETISEYVASLRDLASTCDFGTFLEEALCDQLIEKTSSHRIRERLYAEEDLDLDKAIHIAKRMESAFQNAKVVESHFTNTEVNSVQTTYNHTANTFQKRDQRSSQRGQAAQCYRCGSLDHFANYAHCAAKTQTCSKCQKVGHFAKVCFSEQVNQIDDPQQFILNVNSVNSITQMPRCNVLIQGVSVYVLVDSGSM